MPFSERLADRVRREFAGRRVQEKRMFGGVAFLLRGNMWCGVHGDDLIVRLAPEDTEKALSRPGARIFDMTGRPMKGWILVGPRGTATRTGLKRWIAVAEAYAAALPAKR